MVLELKFLLLLIGK